MEQRLGAVAVYQVGASASSRVPSSDSFVGIAFLLIYPLMKIWPSGWSWQPGQYEYEQMIVSIYATLGVFLLWAARKPEAHVSLIWFTIWSSVVHGLIMAVQAVIDPAERGHLLGDVPALLLVAIVLALLVPCEVASVQAEHGIKRQMQQTD